jgi:nicotinamidase-related amidase
MATKRALIIVDFQEDFCPPVSTSGLQREHITDSLQNGSLAVGGGREIAPGINELLCLPFDLKIATKDFHPQTHISFASNHPPPHNNIGDRLTISNPYNENETQPVFLWPDHCVQGTPGADIVPELDISRIDHVIEKGQDARVEMFSAFEAPLYNPPVSRSGLEDLLRESQITDVYVCGLAADFCVKATAVDGARHGFKTFVIEDATKAVFPDKLPETHSVYDEKGITRLTTAQVKRLFDA